MPNIDLGRIDEFKWNRTNFIILKNVLKHIIISLFYAYNKIGFIHKDLHLGNILLQKTKLKEISYGDFGSLECMGFIPIIMDFDKSNINEEYPSKVYNDIKKYIGHISGDTNIIFNTFNLQNKLVKMFNNNEIITIKLLNQIFKDVDNFTIDYFLDDKPTMPN